MTTVLNPPTDARKAAVTGVRQESYSLDLVQDERGFQALGSCWDHLLDQATTCSPFLRWDWMRLWWKECRGSARLAVGVLRDAQGVPQALAPLMLAREEDGARRHLTALAFISGFGPAHGERLDFIVPAGREDELTPKLCQVFQALQPECDVVRLNFLPQESPNTPHIFAALEQHFIRASVLNRSASRLIHIPRTWEEIELRHSANWRSTLRRHVRALTSRHAATTTVSGAGMLHARAFAEFVKLHAGNFPDGVSTFNTPAAMPFHQRLAEKWLPSGRALMPILQADGVMAAAVYGFVDRGEFFLYQTGWHADYARLSPGKQAVRWALMCCMQRGVHLYDALPGEYEYKRQWGDSTRWLLDLEALNAASWRAGLFHKLRSVRRRLSKPHLLEARTP